MASRSILARNRPLASRCVAPASRLSCYAHVQPASTRRFESTNANTDPQRSKSQAKKLVPALYLHENKKLTRHVQLQNNLDGGVAAIWEDFTIRHIGPREDDVPSMLKELGEGADTMEDFLNQVIPEDVRLPPWEAGPPSAYSESRFTEMFNALADKNLPATTFMNGGGYYQVETPPVIRRNILESPAWYTSYTPYQAEISQGRLESLLNFQTMVSDLTGLPIANASLLDEGTAAAEAMTVSINTLPASRAKLDGKTYVVSDQVHRTTIEVLRGRAEGFGINIETVNLSAPEALSHLDALGSKLVGALVQYPDTRGGVQDFRALADKVHEHGALLTAATDLSALTLLTPPGEWGADIAVGNSQRFGVPLGYGGPHAAFMSVKESSKRRLPGRLVGVSKDRLGRPAMRLALQTREQHIRREKATSNVCTAQALLANMAAMYAVYHGPRQLRDMAIKNVLYARAVAELFKRYGHDVVSQEGEVLSDTVTVRYNGDEASQHSFYHHLRLANIRVTNNVPRRTWTMACTAEMGPVVFSRLARCLAKTTAIAECVAQGVKGPEVTERVNRAVAKAKELQSEIWQQVNSLSADAFLSSIPEGLRRTSSYLTHPVFNTYHSETEMLRYIHHLQSKDLSLTHAMIPLGSCTMKLNATSQMELIGNPRFADIHPHVRSAELGGYSTMLNDLSRQLNLITGMDDCTLQPNSGAQGEFAGLRAIRQYLDATDAKRDICLIPSSAHGTNPASAAMAGMRVVMVKCDSETGNLDMADLKAKCEKHKDELAAIMITYPSTFGVFEPDIIKICNEVHEHGGQVYMDGANMNAQIGLTSPGALGADVCHLNLHKTFCIPHGGGGPGVGPICVKSHLSQYLPHKKDQVPVASAMFGSASILPISWAYISVMGLKGLRKATSMALLNANYLLARLKPHYPIVYTNDQGRCAHEFILDTRPFKASSGIEAADIAKRLQDYGFHPPTLSFPIANTLMIEPTESESKEELDRLADALIKIREEIREIEEGRQPREGNVLKMAPHPQLDLIEGDGEGAWNRPYSRSKAAYPVPGLKERKFWPSVARIDDTYGDTNLYCTCPPIEDYLEEQ